MSEAKVTLYFGHYSSWIIWINSYIIPPAAIVVVATNACVIFVYCTQFKKTRNETTKMSSLLYVAIATSNILAVIPKAVLYIYSFVLGHVTSYIPYELCWNWYFLLKLSIIPHISSIWFVAVLSLQRYMVIRHPFTSGQTWSLRKTVIAVILIVFASFVMETPYIFACKFLPLDLHSFSNFTNITSKLTCHVQYADWLNDSGKEVEIFMLCIILFFVIIVSSTIILYCDFSLIGFLLTSAKVRKLMVNILNYDIESGFQNAKLKTKLQSSRHSSSKRKTNSKLESSDTNHQIKLIVTFSLIVFVVEIPYGIILSLYIYFTVNEIPKPFEWYWVGPIRTIFDVSIVMSYPSLFILSCTLSRRFRRILWASCTNRKIHKNSPTPYSTVRTSVR